VRGSRAGRTWLLWMVMGALVLAVAACGVATPGVPTAAPGPTATPKRATELLELVILYTSHARGDVQSPASSDPSVEPEIGGLTRRATVIEVIRARTPDAHLLLLDGGNTLWGDFPSAATEQSQGKVMVEAMNLMGYDAMALGETDLQLGEDVLRQRMAEADFAVLSANVVVRSSGELFAAPYVLLEAGGRQVGILGLTGTGAGQMVGSLAIINPAGSLAEYMKELQAQTENIIVLSNLGWEANVRLAETVPGIDVIIGAGGSDVSSESWQSPQTGTLVCQPSLFGRGQPASVVTLLTATIDRSGAVTEYFGETVPLEGGWPDDAALQQLLDAYRLR
jgi:5'-nucleotidase/UDP-sugar diphosphatase